MSRLRLSLFLVASSLLAGFAGQTAAQQQTESAKTASVDEVVALVESLGGGAMRDPEKPGQPILYLTFSGTPVPAVATKSGPPRAVTNISDADLERLTKLPLPELVSLSFSNVGVTDAGLVHLSKIPKLSALGLSGPTFTDAGLVHLSKLPKLNTLVLSGTNFSDRSMAEVGKLDSLVHLTFPDGKLTDKGLVHCEKLTKLESLRLRGNKGITDAGLVHLKRLDSLTTLDLSATNITDAGLKQLAGLTNLQFLTLNETRVTDAGLVHLVGLRKLFELNLMHTTVTAAGIKTLAAPRLNYSPVPVEYREPALEAPKSKQAERLAEVVSWLPPDTETVLVARGPFTVGNEKVAASQSVAAFLELRLAWPSLMSLQERKYASDLQGTRVGLAVEGGRRFQPPTDIEARRYEGCRIILFEEDFATKGDRLFEKVFRDASATEEIASHKVALFKEPAEHMTIFVARPAPNIMIEATDRAYLEEVLKRRQQKDLARPGLLDSPAWKKLDPGARYWLVRTYAKPPGDDITSPYLEGSRTADSKAQALAFAFPKAAAKSPVMFYFSDNEDAARIAKKSWGEPAIVEPVEAGVTSIRYPIADVQDLDAFVMWLSWHFGYHEYP